MRKILYTSFLIIFALLFVSCSSNGKISPKQNGLASDNMVEIKVVTVARSAVTSDYLVVVGVLDDSRRMNIFIGENEAIAIARKIAGLQFSRPLTHDLLKNTIDRLGGEVTSIVITKIENNTFFAQINVSTNGKAIVLDARPSDAIALAVRTGARIFAAPVVLKEAGYDVKKKDDDIEEFNVPDSTWLKKI